MQKRTGGAVVSNVASQQEGPGLGLSVNLHVFPMSGFAPGTLASSHN